jgi:hypothetical protein
LRFLDRGERFSVVRLFAGFVGPIDQYACVVDLGAGETTTIITTSRDFLWKLEADFDDFIKQPNSARLALNGRPGPGCQGHIVGIGFRRRRGPFDQEIDLGHIETGGLQAYTREFNPAGSISPVDDLLASGSTILRLRYSQRAFL